MALSVQVWPYAFVKPGPSFSDSDATKFAAAEYSVAKVDLKDYPLNHEVLGAIVYLTGPFTNTSTINIRFKAYNDATGQILFDMTGSVPTPKSQGWDWWNWYKWKFWIGHASWEISGPMKVRMNIKVTEGTTTHYDGNIYQEVIDTSLIIPPPIIILEETKEFWTAKGYTAEDAQKLADWCKANKMSPTLETIETIIKGEYSVGTAYRLAWEKVVERAKAKDIYGMSLALIDLGNVKISPELNADAVYIGPASVPVLMLKGKGLAEIGLFILRNYKTFFALIAGAYGLSFATSWFGKEGLIEQVSIPLSDSIRQLNYQVTKEQLAIAESYYAKYAENIETADKLISTVSWLWLPTRSEWLAYIATARLDLAEKRKMLDKFQEELIGVAVPEKIIAVVSDIIDGDTIDVRLQVKNAVTGEIFNLPEYAATGHARIRIPGINAPEKSPKGEIVCTGIELYKVDAHFADDATANLISLNEKEVTLYIDPANRVDSYGRLLARVDYNGVDMGLSQIKKGLACYYQITIVTGAEVSTNKYIDDNLYKSSQELARLNKVGFWAVAEAAIEEAEKGKILFSIDTIPSNAKVIIDGAETHHNTPTDETEQKDMIALWTEGAHTLKLQKSGMIKEVPIILVRNERLELVVDLTAMPSEVPEEIIPPEIPTEEIIPPEIPAAAGAITFLISSNPSNAKVWIDEIYTHHVTPTDEKEQKDVIKLWTEGKHKLRLTKSGYSAEKEITLVKGVKLTETLDLTGMITPLVTPLVEEIPAAEVPALEKLPAVYTAEQNWALKEAFAKIWELEKGTAQVSEKEFKDLKASFNLYSAGQKVVLDLLFTELYPYIKGTAQLSNDEFIFLKEKYRMI